MSTGLAIIIYCLGVVLVLLEVIIPSFGLLTTGAIACFVISVWSIYDPAHPGYAWAMGIVAPIFTILVLYFGLKYIPRTSWGSGLVLRQPEGEEQKPTATQVSTLSAGGATVEERFKDLVGKTGVAQSDLRPAGVALVEGKRVDVVADGAMIDAGSRIKVVAVQGNRVVVRKVQV